MAKKINIFLLLFPFLVAGQDKPGWKSWSLFNCAIQYPSSWQLDESGKMGTTFFIFAPLESTQDKFRENINLMIQDLKGKKIDLKKYTQISEKQVKTFGVNSKIIESKTVKKNGRECQRMLYTSDQSGFHLKYLQYYFILHGNAYVLTFTSELDKFDTYKEIADKILDSFAIRK